MSSPATRSLPTAEQKPFALAERPTAVLALIAVCLLPGVIPFPSLSAEEPGIDSVEAEFRTLPASARRLTGPLLWLHGDESRERIEQEISKIAEGGNGTFTTESRPHKDWLGEGWWRDLAICRDAARKHDLTMWIFDEEFFPSGEVAGEVPRIYGSKVLNVKSHDVRGPKRFTRTGFYVPLVASIQQRYKGNLVAVLAGRDTSEGIDGNSLIDLTGLVKNGSLTWDAPEGNWKVMVFTWAYYVDDQRWASMYGPLWDPAAPLVDGASKDAVEWYLRTVYQPHYDHFREDFGKTIRGFFYDEPDTPGDWGTEVFPVLKERGVDWKKALVAHKLKLAGDEQAAAKYQYQDAFAEAWGQTMYGGITEWCHRHHVESIGHWIEHDWCYLKPWFCAGNMFQLLKYSDLGAIDNVCLQIMSGKRNLAMDLMPKLASSISHAYAKREDVAMCEMFGGFGQTLTYPDMKWQTDLMQVWGVNFLIPHSFNCRAPRDTDAPPYFYNGGHEPRWPLYRVYADYASRLSLMLTGGRHVCPVAFLFSGTSHGVGAAIPPEAMTRVMQEALFDCDWIPYEVFERDTKLAGKTARLHKEGYRILVVPPVEVIPYATLAKAKEFYEGGGVVIGYGYLPSKSATLGRLSSEIVALCDAIWGRGEPGFTVRNTNARGGRSYFLPEKVTSENIQQVLTADASLHPTLEVIEGVTDHWLYVLHRVKSGRDVFFVCNQSLEPQAKHFRLRVTAHGVPECWDAMRNEITAVPFKRFNTNTVDVDLTLEASESVLLVFQDQARELPMRIDGGTKMAGSQYIEVARHTPSALDTQGATKARETPVLRLDRCAWVWHPDGEPESIPPAGTRYFAGSLTLPPNATVKSARFVIAADNSFVLQVNGRMAGRGDDWHSSVTIDISNLLRPGKNRFAITAVNSGEQPSPAGLIGSYLIELENGEWLSRRIDLEWKTTNRLFDGWADANFDDSAWLPVRVLAKFGGAPWGAIVGPGPASTESPVAADFFEGSFTISERARTPGARVYLEMDELAPEAAAHVSLNGKYVGGFIGRPFRLDVSSHIGLGINKLTIVPFAPKSARLVMHQVGR